MAFAAGAKLGPYEIVARLGAGGMGEVWKAHDTRLGRDVAIKICREEFTAHFEREARAIAALNHPNICQLYDVGPDYLVMELIDGPTLQERIEQGALPVEEALNLATQIAAALDAAHEKGVVHRDLKPANIKLTAGGVKVLDFGLAKMADLAAGSPDISHSPTMTMGPTAGMILGTAAYMSPEQAKGRTVDKRADIWAFGVVLYEMLTGSKGFRGDTLSEILAAILRDDVDANALPASTPIQVRALLRHCLQKDPKRRLRDIGDVNWEVEEQSVVATAPQKSRVWLLWLAIIGLTIIAVAGWLRRSPSTAPAEFALTIVPPAGVTLAPVGGQLAAPEVSPDGRTVIYGTPEGFFARSIDSVQSRLLNGFQGLSGRFFWSPDSKSVMFPRARALMRVRLPDGAPERIATLPNFTRGGTWSDRGTILISSGSALYTVAASGGELKHVETAGLNARRLVYPEFIPGTEVFIFLAVANDLDEGAVYLATLRDGKAVDQVLLLKSDTPPRYTGFNGGRLLFIRNDTLYSQKLDLNGRKLTGDPVVVEPGVASGPGRDVAFGDFSVSQSGVVVWRPGKAALSQVTTFDRRGNVVGTSGPPSGLTSVVLSPDESRLLAYGDGSWLLEPSRPSRIALPGDWEWVLWSADSAHFLGFREAVHGRQENRFGERAVTGSDSVRELGDVAGFLMDVSPDGKNVLWMPATGGGTVSLPIDGTAQNRSPEVVVQTGEQVGVTRFSPDGLWVVYMANSGAGMGIFVQPFKRPGLRTQIADPRIGRIGYPEWRKDGKEIVFIGEYGFWAVSVDATKGGLRFGAPEKLFSGFRRPAGMHRGSRPFAVSRDGSRIYAVQAVEQPDTNMIHVKMMRATEGQ